MKNLLTLLFVLFLFPLFAQNTLPAFSFLDLEGKVFTQENLEPGRSTFIMFFDPYCDHCSQQAEWITAEADLFAGTTLIWVTTEVLEPTQDFFDSYFKGSALQHVHVLRDPDFMFDAYFGYSEAPTIFLYDAAGKKLKEFRKETKVEELLKYL